MTAKSLTREQLDALLAVAVSYSVVDYLMFLVTFNHGLRSSETLALTAENIVDGFLVVQRLKGSNKTTQPLLPNEAEGLKKLAAESNGGPLFKSYRMDFWRKMQKYGTEAGIPSFLLHAHALKHTCGKLGYKGGMTIPEVQTWLGHVNGGNTMVYMQADENEAANAFMAALNRPPLQKTFAAVAGV